MKIFRALSKDTFDNFTALKTSLADDLERAHECMDERSEAWHNSEVGEEYAQWVEAIEEVIEAIDQLELPTL